MSGARTAGSRTAAALLLTLLVVAAFWPVLGHDYVGLDDERYVTDNRRVQAGLGMEGLRWAWTTFHAANWHPLTWMSHMLDQQLFGRNATGHHLSSLLLHAANALLLFLLFERLTGQRLQSAVVALLFGIHPLHVESVAWVAERKDVLSTLFWLLALLAYAGYARSPGPGRYLVVALAMAAALCAKPMPVTLPLTLLLLDYWPLDRSRRTDASRRSWRRLWAEKIPLLAISAASCAVTLAAQSAGGAVASFEIFPLHVRVANAVVAYATYLRRTVWPTGLALPYPHPGADLPWWTLGGAAALILVVSYGVVRSRHNHPQLLFGWLWFLVTLVPVIGVVQVGMQAMADRYTYVPLIGLFVMAVWGIPSVVGPLWTRTRRRSVRRHSALLAATFVVTPLLIIGTRGQLAHWRDDAALARRALSVTRNNAVAYNQLGLALMRRGQAADAVPHFREAIEIRPRFVEPYNNLGGAFVELGRVDEAVANYLEALQIHPEYPEALLNLGVARVRQGRMDEAVERFEEALRLRPDYGKAHANLAAAYFSLGDVRRARREIELALDGGFEPPEALVRAVERFDSGE